MEMFRLSTDSSFRKRGIAIKLMNKLEETANSLNMDCIYATTDNGKETALRFYKKNNWEIIEKFNYINSVLDFCHLIVLRKYVKHEK